MTDPAPAGQAVDPGEDTPGDFRGPEQADWMGITRVLGEAAAATAPLFKLPRSGKAALVVILLWWPILLSILFIVATTIAAYLFGLAVTTVGMSRPLPERRRTVIALMASSCIAAAVAVALSSLTVASLESPLIVALAAASVGSALVVCIMQFRRYLQHSDRWQPRRAHGATPA